MENATRALLDAAVEEGHGGRVALHTPAGDATYGELLGLVTRAAAALRARGVGRGDRVALLLPDGLGWAAAFFAALRQRFEGPVAVEPRHASWFTP
ncbi:MAG TPA: AMP-binding protein, partial [Methylomirabilota bacterium]|nr:AMP-binding protein [Methylomirabilota bacterium]